MTDWLALFLKAFIPLLIAIDPIGLAAMFLSLGSGIAPDAKRRISQQAVWTGGLVALLFLFLGRTLFEAVGITVSDFQIAGGLILLVLAGRDLVQAATEEPTALAEDFGVVPLGMPLIAGPATITTLLILTPIVGYTVTVWALAVNLLLVVLAFRFSGVLGRAIGSTGLRAISKIVALLLAAIAVSMIRQGIRAG